MRSLVLSVFDIRRGPQILLVSPPDSLPKELESRIPNFMDIYDQGFFINVEEGVTVANKVYDIKSSVARGHKELLLISVVLKEEGINLQLAGLLEELLERFAKHCKDMQNLYIALHNELPESSEKRKEITIYFNQFAEIMQSAVKTVRETEVRYQTLFKKARDGIVLLEYQTGKFVDANQQAENIIGRILESILGKTPLDLGILPKEEYSEMRIKVIEQIHNPKMPPFESSVVLPDNHRVLIEISANKIHVWDQDLVQCIFRNISYRKGA